MRVLKHIRDYDLAPLISVLLVCAFPCVFMWAQNAKDAGPASMLTFLLIFGVNALLFLVVTLPFFRNFSRAAFFTDLAMLVVINFSLISDKIEALLPWLWSRYILIIFGVILLAIFVLLWRKKPDMRIPCVLIAIAFASVTLMNVIMNIQTIYKSLRPMDPPVVLAEDTGIEFTQDKVNVYYFMFDEYAGYENLLHYYDYDNNPFLNELEEKGFTVSRSSRNTEAVYTYILMPNLMNLNYVMSVHDYSRLQYYYLDESYMVRMFRQNGYQINLANHLNYVGEKDVNLLTGKQDVTNLSWFILQNTIYWKVWSIGKPLVSYFHMNSHINSYTSLMETLAAEQDCWQHVGDGPTLTIGYAQTPHSPMIVNREGEMLPRKQSYNWKNSQLYLDQLEFTNAHILSMVEKIQANDPDALIILQSDHGCRYPIHMIQVHERKEYDPYEENTYMQNVLNCVYYKGQSFDIEGETGINTLRKVFSEVLGADLEPIEPVVDYTNLTPWITPFE